MIKIGIVGVGSVGILHKKAIDAHPECELAAVCNRTESRAVALAEGTNARTYSDYKVMQEQEDLDAVIVNLPHDMHKDVSIYFLEHKVAVLVEKPMANSVEECDAMIAAAKKSGTALAVGHVQRYLGFNRELKKLVQNGRLGKLCAIIENRSCDYFTDRPAWFLDKKQSGGGILMNYGAHSMDKILYTTGLSIEKVSAVTSNFLTDDNVEATAQLLLTLSGGVSAVLTHCGCHIPSIQETTFYFTEGAAQARGWELWVSEKGGEYTQVDCGDISKNFMEDQIEEFVKFLKEEPSEIVTAEYARDVICALETAYKQAE